MRRFKRMLKMKPKPRHGNTSPAADPPFKLSKGDPARKVEKAAKKA
jgi:hypothetical protein